MTDRELLEAAAKAAGIDGNWHQAKPGVRAMFWHTNVGEWNPLTDDGDALRLAVKLHIALLFPMRGDTYPLVGAGLVGSMAGAKQEPHDPDPYAAMRRAIVRAAAAMVKA